MEPTYIDLTTPKNSAFRITEMYDKEAISNSLRNIFSTPLGSLPGKPYFGTRIFSMVFEVIDEITKGILRTIITEEIAKFEPRITVREINIDSYPEYNKLSIEVVYVYNNKEKNIEGSTTLPIKL